MAEEIDHDGNIELLARSQSVDLTYREYRRNLRQEEGDLVRPLETLESLVSNGDDIAEGAFMTATPQAIEFAVKGYQNQNKKSREKGVKESGAHIAEGYILQLEILLGKAVKKISSQKGFDELPEEDQARVMEPQLYLQIASGLSELDPKEKELDKDEKALRTLSKIDDEDQKRDATQGYLQARGLSHMKYVIDHRDAPQRAASRLYRLLAKKLIERDEEGNYSISRDAFIKLFGTEENYKKIALSLKIAEEQSRYKKAA